MSAFAGKTASGEVTLRYIPDPQMPADFLTKWLDATKTEKSIAYATNSRASLAHPAKAGP